MENASESDQLGHSGSLTTVSASPGDGRSTSGASTHADPVNDGPGGPGTSGPSRLWIYAVVVSLVVLLVIIGLWRARSDDPPVAKNEGRSEVQDQVVEVLGRYDHDATLFTQGLELADTGIIESAGQTGESSIRIYDPFSGEVRVRGTVDPEYFAEGVTAIDDETLVQITWQNGVALKRDAATLEVTDTWSYEGEGWGICTDSESGELVMSDGSSTLSFRNADSFEVTRRLTVSDENGPVEMLNELECVDGSVYANVWQTDRIVKIDLRTGFVAASIDAAGLITPEEAPEPGSVLNGIAYRRETKTFIITGKWWPSLFEVRFVDR